MQEMRRETFDLLVVDWELPDTSGPQVVKWVREKFGNEIPILFITHRSEDLLGLVREGRAVLD